MIRKFRVRRSLTAVLTLGICTTIAAQTPRTSAPRTSAPRTSAPRTYLGLCDASAIVALDADRFLVASDEDNVLRAYDRRQGPLPLQAFDLNHLLAGEPGRECDIEGVTSIGRRQYWITSHGLNKDAELRTSRFRLFATEAAIVGNRTELRSHGRPYGDLVRDSIADPALRKYDFREASRRPPKVSGALNIEGLAAMPDGSALWLGYRNPIPHGKALLIPLLNYAELVATGRGPARFGTPVELDLGGRGIRSMEYSPERSGYLIVAGGHDREIDAALYFWSGAADAPAVKYRGVDFGKLAPEGLAVFPGLRDVLIVHDDGTRRIGEEVGKQVGSSRRQGFRAQWFTD